MQSGGDCNKPSVEPFSFPHSQEIVAVPQSVIEAVKMGYWDYEPVAHSNVLCEATDAVPGSMQKLEVLAERLERGLPLWHPADRISYEDAE
jgi:hypothetical protein